MLEINRLYNDDCFNKMKEIDDHSIDMILTDPPYNCTICKFDQEVIDIDKMWSEYKRIIKPGGNIIIHCKQPFTTKVINGNPDWLKYEIIWMKSKCSNFLQTKKRLGCYHENILVFYEDFKTFNQQENKDKMYKLDKKFQEGKEKLHGYKISDDSMVRSSLKIKYGYKGRTIVKQSKRSIKSLSESFLRNINGIPYSNRYLYSLYNSVLYFANEYGKTSRLHGTQKPLKLEELLIKLYSNEGDLILDTFGGICTTAVACKLQNRNFIVIEKDEKYYNSGLDRLNNRYGEFDVKPQKKERNVRIKKEVVEPEYNIMDVL